MSMARDYPRKSDRRQRQMLLLFCHGGHDSYGFIQRSIRQEPGYFGLALSIEEVTVNGEV